MSATLTLSQISKVSLLSLALVGCALTPNKEVHFGDPRLPSYTLTDTAVRILKENEGRLLSPEKREHWVPTLPVGYTYTMSHAHWESCPSKITKIEQGAYHISRYDCQGNVIHKNVIRVANGVRYSNRDNKILHKAGECAFVLGEVCKQYGGFGVEKYTTKYVDGVWFTIKQLPFVTELYIHIFSDDGLALYHSKYRFGGGQSTEYFRTTPSLR
ncbi:hypothetical protein VIBNISO65_p0019 [Vibrio nigripulchritudo SO65]|uniref:hypothetical protein n=1 Tax=Vibrio nigripulchritudo TaxID=28173 RepID=UPI0003B21D71|nr:hypothetical protein [Vibrio nigripulchritudo]CCN38619.1 hypothetical protein VIBNIAM115_p0020 [Vibrio nigripulchritudo AM115]CCN44928.1 hypothetical protein VIBNIFTn2_p0019 [Vibrio nigripulchritudo FTn2]CCN79683.1 hypothetical protein VIBNISO65_p0019 [Vibrio nigripulchritudo SO65]